jgi:hypothetical protein
MYERGVSGYQPDEVPPRILSEPNLAEPSRLNASLEAFDITGNSIEDTDRFLRLIDRERYFTETEPLGKNTKSILLRFRLQELITAKRELMGVFPEYQPDSLPDPNKQRAADELVEVQGSDGSREVTYGHWHSAYLNFHENPRLEIQIMEDLIAAWQYPDGGSFDDTLDQSIDEVHEYVATRFSDLHFLFNNLRVRIVSWTQRAIDRISGITIKDIDAPSNDVKAQLNETIIRDVVSLEEKVSIVINTIQGQNDHLAADFAGWKDYKLDAENFSLSVRNIVSSLEDIQTSYNEQSLGLTNLEKLLDRFVVRTDSADGDSGND